MLKDGHRVVDGWCRNCGRTAGAILRVPFPAVFSWDRPRCDLSRLSFSDVIAGRQFAHLTPPKKVAPVARTEAEPHE